MTKIREKRGAGSLLTYVFFLVLACSPVPKTPERQAAQPLPSWQVFEKGIKNPQTVLYTSTKTGNSEIFLRIGGVDYNLSDHPGLDESPSWSRDGSLLVFQSNRNGNLDIFALHVKTGILEQITTHTQNDYSPSLHPNGKTFYFVSDRQQPEELESTPHFYRKPLKGGPPLRWIKDSPGKTASITWSPTGERAVVSMAQEGETKSPSKDLWLFHRDGWIQARLTKDEADAQAPAFSPDGRWLAYARSLESGLNSIELIQVDGDKQVQVLPPGWNKNPDFSADGMSLLITAKTEKNPHSWNLYRCLAFSPRAENPLVPVVVGPGDNQDGRFSPLGKIPDQ